MLSGTLKKQFLNFILIKQKHNLMINVKNIAVFGAGGSIGRALVNLYAKSDDIHVTAISRKRITFDLSNVTSYQCDPTNEGSLKAFAVNSKNESYDLIISTVGTLHGDGCHLLELNSIGSLESRIKYASMLKEYFMKYEKELDADDIRRLDKNPLRILDSKNEKIKDIKASAPRINEHLDKESQEDFELLCSLLEDLSIPFVINPRLVRGLDYYNKTVFEWTTDKLGAQSAICSGGRYDGLVAQLGGESVPACGWALGIERIMALIKAENISINELRPGIYAIPLGLKAAYKMPEIIERVKERLINTIIWGDYSEGSLKSKMKKADKSGAQVALILGEDELNQGKLMVKLLREEGSQESIPLDDVSEVVARILGK